MDEIALQLLQESVSFALLVGVLVGLYRLASRILSIGELGFDKFLNDFERIADGIQDIAKNGGDR